MFADGLFARQSTRRFNELPQQEVSSLQASAEKSAAGELLGTNQSIVALRVHSSCSNCRKMHMRWLLEGRRIAAQPSLQKSYDDLVQYVSLSRI